MSWINAEVPFLLFCRKIRLEVNNFEEKRTVENVIGYIKGKTEPGELAFRKFLSFMKLVNNMFHIDDIREILVYVIVNISPSKPIF